MKYIKPWKQGKLRVSENGRYLHNGEQPFFYLGDTAWLLCPVCDEKEAKLYLTNRRDGADSPPAGNARHQSR